MYVEMTIAGTRPRLLAFRQARLDVAREHRLPWALDAAQRDDELINVLESASLRDGPGGAVLGFAYCGKASDLEAVFSEIRAAALKWGLRPEEFWWNPDDDQRGNDNAVYLPLDGWTIPRLWNAAKTVLGSLLISARS